ncbi:MAG: hypothetical protein WA110_08955 [Anaerolineaceae bacterium]
MALAAYEFAKINKTPFVYLQSEGKKSVIYEYDLSLNSPSTKKITLGPLINIKEYLQVHGQKDWVETPAANAHNAQEVGLAIWFKAHTDECISNLHYGVGEVDFIIRRQNQVAVVESKMVKAVNRKGIDQLNTICGRENLGTYTGKILIIQNPLGTHLQKLAEDRNISVIQVSGEIPADGGYFVPDAESEIKLVGLLDKLLGASLE